VQLRYSRENGNPFSQCLTKTLDFSQSEGKTIFCKFIHFYLPLSEVAAAGKNAYN
jgi:hypothetical protein